MMMVRRNLSPSKLKNLLSPHFYSLSTSTTYTYTTPVSNCPTSRILDPLNPAKTLPFFFLTRPFSSKPSNVSNFPVLPFTRDGNYDEGISQNVPFCPGCGVPMQDTDPNQPGFFVEPMIKSTNYKRWNKKNQPVDECEIPDLLKKGFVNEIVDVGKGPDIKNSENVDGPDREKPGKLGKNRGPGLGNSENLENVESPDEKKPNKLGKHRGPVLENSENWENVESPDGKKPDRPIVCARCHNLRYYGKVKDPKVENLLPSFDFDHTVGRRLMSVTGARTVVMLVVDAADFDGSFPKKVASLVSKTVDENLESWKEGKSGNVPRIVLVVTKIDLLPSSVSPTRVEHWVRTRARENGAGRLASLHLVSSVKEWGVKNLVDDVVGLAGPRGHVWAVGAQNAGKSTLINAMGKCGGGGKEGVVSCLTEAPVPGTTLGIVRVEGVLPGKAKLFDTPGLLVPGQVMTRLTREEQRLVHIHKELKPRTYRIKAGHSVHIGGLMRLDIEECSADSIYVTVWTSPLIPLHMGKTENVRTMLEQHFGHQLQPPIGEGRVEQLGKWTRKEIHVSGNWWDSSSVDIAAAGLGWFAIGLKGEAQLGVWTYDGIEVVFRNALLPQRSHKFEVAGFAVSEIVSKADRARNNKRKDKKRKLNGLTTSHIESNLSPVDLSKLSDNEAASSNLETEFAS